jgi:type IV secretory pathway TrbF-like protein
VRLVGYLRKKKTNEQFVSNLIGIYLQNLHWTFEVSTAVLKT